MKGPKYKPTLLKKINGNPGKRPLPRNEPKPKGKLNEPPAWFSETQRESWAYALKHAPPGMLAKIDRGALVVWVIAEDLHRQAAIEQGRLGQLLVKAPNTGLPIQSPHLPIINKQAQIMLKAAEQLGFTPAARPRLEAPEPTPMEPEPSATHEPEVESVASKYLQ